MKEVRTRTATGRWIGGFLVFVHTHEAPSDTEWDQILALFRTALEQRKVRALVYTEGGAPNARQRALLNDLLEDIKPRVAVLTPSPAARAAGVAISWFNPDLRVFPGDDLDRAFDHLDANHVDRRILTETLAELRTQGTKSDHPAG